MDLFDIAVASKLAGGGGGGGSSNIVTGTFKGTDSGTSHAEDVTLDYSGSGYPIFVAIFVNGGIGGNTDFGDAVHRYAYDMYAIQKEYALDTPNYTGSGNGDKAAYIAYYKNSTSSSVSYSQAGSHEQQLYNDANATANNGNSKVVQIKDAKTLSVFISRSGITEGYGFLAGIEYKYIVVYSS